MEKAAAFVRDAGGVERARVFTHMWLALGGQWSWDDDPGAPAGGDPAADVVSR